MKKLFSAILLAGILAATGCSENPAEEQQGPGQVVFAVEASGSVSATEPQNRAAGQRPLPAAYVPDAEDFALTVTTAGGDFVSSYENLSSYDQPLWEKGDYHVKFTYGDPTKEGPATYYFEASTPFTVIARKTVTISLSAALTNSAVSLATTTWFDNYYTSASLTLRTESGYKSAYTINKEQGHFAPGTVPFFAKPGSKLYLSGSAVKTNGVKVNFPETEIGTTAARTWHSVAVDATPASQLSIVVSLDDQPGEIIPEAIELNPEA